VAILVSASLLLFPWQPDVGTSPTIWQIAAWAFTVLVLTIGFIGLARAKTDGQWGWRWGKVGR